MKGERAPTKAASPPTEPWRLDTAMLRNAREFASLEAEWDELYESCPSATPFQSWEWLYSWWEVYGEGSYGLRLVTLRDEEGLLVGLLPLMVHRSRLLLLGGDVITYYSDVMTPYKDVLVREGWEGQVAEAGARALEGLDGWLVADLQELMPEAAAWGIFRKWDGPKTSVPIADYVLMHAESWEDLLSSLSRRLRKVANNTVRRLEKDGVRCEPAGLQDAGQAARRLVALHRELWRGRRIAPEHLTPRYEAFMETAARRMTTRRIGTIYEYWQDDTVVFSDFLVFDKDFVGAYRVGATQEASHRYQLETLGNWPAMNVASSRSNAYVSLMDGTSPEKQRWASEVVSSQRAILGRGRAVWVPYAGYYVLLDRYFSLLSEGQSYVHAESAPRWIKNATDRYYALQRYVYSESAPRWIRSATERYWKLRYLYGFDALRYKYELARAHRQMHESNSSR